MGRGILRGAGGDENLKSNFIWPYLLIHDSLDDLSELFNLEVFFCAHHRYAVLDFWIT